MSLRRLGLVPLALFLALAPVSAAGASKAGKAKIQKVDKAKKAPKPDKAQRNAALSKLGLTRAKGKLFDSTGRKLTKPERKAAKQQLKRLLEEGGGEAGGETETAAVQATDTSTPPPRKTSASTPLEVEPQVEQQVEQQVEPVAVVETQTAPVPKAQPLASAIVASDGGIDVSGLTPREQAAIKMIGGRLASLYPGTTYRITVPMIGFAGDKNNPITGLGPIEVHVVRQSKPTTLTGKGIEAIKSAGDRTYIVLVNDEAGENVQVLFEHSSNFVARSWRQLNEAVPVKEFISDVLKSAGVRRGLLIGGTGASTGNLPITLLTTAKGLADMQSGIERRQVARKQAIKDTIAELKARVEKGESITFVEAYDRYREVLETAKAGTTPIDELAFAKKLRTAGL
jgi:hypothetical protein